MTREGATVGVDRGVVTFLDGWLHFEGYRTTFSLSRADVERRKDDDHLDLRQGGGIDFRADRKVEKEFSTALDRWYRLDPAEGVSLLPPIRLHPSGVVRAQADLVYQATKVALGAVALFLVFRLFNLPIWIVVFFGGTGGLVDAVSALQRVRRFAREERALANETRSAVGR